MHLGLSSDFDPKHLSNRAQKQVTESVVLFIAELYGQPARYSGLCVHYSSALTVFPWWLVWSFMNSQVGIYVKGRSKMCRIQSISFGYYCDNFNIYENNVKLSYFFLDTNKSLFALD